MYNLEVGKLFNLSLVFYIFSASSNIKVYFLLLFLFLVTRIKVLIGRSFYKILKLCFIF